MMLKPEPERRGFQLTPMGLADVSVSKHHVWSLLLHKVILSIGKILRKVHFCITIMARKSMKDL